MAKASVECPACASRRVWKDGMRDTGSGDVQRWVCRACGYRFSESSSRRGFHKSVKGPTPRVDRRICARAAKNLAEVDVVQDGFAGATEFARKLKAEGYAAATIKGCVNYLNRMEREGVNVLQQDQVKDWIAGKTWQNHSKATTVAYYGVFAKVMHIQWDPPRYRYESKLPFVPLEHEVDALIAGTGPKTSVLLQFLKETGARIGEALKVEWKDLDLKRESVTINHPGKGSLPRVLPISKTLVANLSSLPRKNKHVFCSHKNSVYANFQRSRRRLAEKLKNPRLLRISFHTFRHFFASRLYAKTLSLLKVQQALGHKNIKNTMIYTHLVDFKADDYEVQVAETVDEAKKLVEAGFNYVNTIGKRHLYRRPK